MGCEIMVGEVGQEKDFGLQTLMLTCSFAPVAPTCPMAPSAPCLSQMWVPLPLLDVAGPPLV